MRITREFVLAAVHDYRQNRIVRFFNTVVAKQWPRPLKFVRESAFKKLARVSNVKQRNELTGKLLYISISGNRFCLNIGREHKRNEIFFVVNEAKNVYYQRCFDRNCIGFHSPKILLKTKFKKTKKSSS